jgi:hypothetical protein
MVALCLAATLVDVWQALDNVAAACAVALTITIKSDLRRSRRTR